ncbi:MAG: alpha/beta fold hydrolase, partial [Bacteriovoracaceae bacterium]
LFAAARFKAPKSISVPILFLISKKDQLASAKCGERLAKHLKAYTEFHEEAGHDLPLDDPSWIIEKTQSFLKDETIFSEEAFKG